MKKTILLALTLVSATFAIAQNRHEASVYLGGGYSSLKYDLNVSGETTSKFGTLFGIGYTYKINSEWRFVSGLEMASYKSDINAQEMKDRYMTQDNYGNDFEWRLTLHNLKENLTGTYLNIPVMVQFIPKGFDKFYTNLGFKVGMPLSGKYSTKYTKLTASGYYPETDAEYTDIDFRGFGEFEGSSSKGDIDLGVAFILSAECGMKWNLSNSRNLYVGGYVDYGLNNIVKENDRDRVVSYDKENPTNMIYNSLTHSRHTDGVNTQPIIDKVVPLAFGLKMRLEFSL